MCVASSLLLLSSLLPNTGQVGPAESNLVGGVGGDAEDGSEHEHPPYGIRPLGVHVVPVGEEPIAPEVLHYVKRQDTLHRTWSRFNVSTQGI